MAPPAKVVVIIGTGGIGIACARRLAAGRTLIITNTSQKSLNNALAKLCNEGYEPEGHVLDITDASAVQAFAAEAASRGPLDVVVHTSGINPTSGTTKQILDINLLGASYAIDAFEHHVGPGTSLIVIGSMAGHMALPAVSNTLRKHMVLSPTAELLPHVEVPETLEPNPAYCIAKAAVMWRVQGAAGRYAAKGARINSVSPGTVYTPMFVTELTGPNRDVVTPLIDSSAFKKVGTAEDIAGAVVFLAGSDASFITGTDILVDGWQIGGARWVVPQIAEHVETSVRVGN